MNYEVTLFYDTSFYHIIKAKGEKRNALFERRSYPLLTDSEPIIRHLRETCILKIRTFYPVGF
ncbi:MAG: hypothetical protein RLZZ306_1846 [Bacteroidota bacterium]